MEVMEAFQVYLKISKSTIKTVDVPKPRDADGKFTIFELKKQAISYFPGVTDMNQLRLIFNGKDLENDKKLEFYKIEKLSVIHAVLKTRGGKGLVHDEDFPRTQSMAGLFISM